MDELQVADIRSSVCFASSIGIIVIITVMSTIEEPALDKDSPLDGECSEKEVETKWRPWVSFQESHQETETDDDHHVNILEP